MKPTPYSWRTLQRYLECDKRCCGLGDLSVPNQKNKNAKQTTKQATFMDRLYSSSICMITFQKTGLREQGYIAICERHPYEYYEEGLVGVVQPRNMMSPLR
jgi:hypothetical protein